MSYDLKNVLNALSEFGTTFDQTNDVPVSGAALRAAGDDTPTSVTQPSLRGVLNEEDRVYLQRGLMGMSERELAHLFYLQLGSKEAKGVPIAQWMSGSRGLMDIAGDDPVLTNLLDLSGGSALVRQDLDPILYTQFVKAFPAYDRIPKVPANGAVHAWRQVTDYGDAVFMAELGTVTDDTSTYVPQTTNIAIQNTRRGVSFKEQFAVAAGGMGWNPQQLEIQNGLIAMAHKTQKTIFQGQASNSGGTANDELGLYDPNGFTGLRSILNIASAVNFQPYLTSNPDSFNVAFGAAATAITDAVGVPPTVIFARAAEGQQFANAQLTIQRTVDRTEFVPGVSVPAVMTNQGMLPLVTVPGDSIGTYVTSNADGPFSGGETVADIYILNESTITLPYLGSPGPTVIEIPPGVNGQLTRLFIIYYMVGLAVTSLPYNVKLRVDQATS
jgi:hypothetical protein